MLDFYCDQNFLVWNTVKKRKNHEIRTFFYTWVRLFLKRIFHQRPQKPIKTNFHNFWIPCTVPLCNFTINISQGECSGGMTLLQLTFLQRVFWSNAKYLIFLQLWSENVTIDITPVLWSDIISIFLQLFSDAFTCFYY